jgi:hypothetical protein
VVIESNKTIIHKCDINELIGVKNFYSGKPMSFSVKSQNISRVALIERE